MLAPSEDALWECGAGRGAGMRATDGRFFTGRRSAGRATGFGGAGLRGAFLGGTFAVRRIGLFAFAALRATGRFALPLPPPFPLPLAMRAPCQRPCQWANPSASNRRGGGRKTMAVGDTYRAVHARSLSDPESFWAEQARAIDWSKHWDKVLDSSSPPFY